MRINELRAQRAALVNQARAKIDVEAPTDEDHSEFDRLMGEADKIKAQIDRLERSDLIAAELGNMADTTARQRRQSPDQVAEEQARELEVFNHWARFGLSNMSPEDRQLANERIGPISGIRNAQGVGTAGAGGYTVPPAFMAELLVALKAFGGMREAARQIDTPAGQDIPWPTLDDTANEGEILAENTQTSQQDLVFGSKTLKGYTYSSKLVLVSWQLLQDSAFDIPGLLRDAFANRLGRVTNRHFTVGTGSSQPEGIVTGASLGATAASTTAVTFDELIELEHSVDPAYRPNSRFMFHDTALKNLRKVKDSDGQYIWQMGTRDGVPDTILNRPYTINQHMPTPAAAAKTVLFGDFRNYIIRNIKDMQVVRLNEKYADYLQTGFFAYGRWDGRLVSAGTPVKYLAQAAS